MSGPFIADIDPAIGYWSPSTASVDWCEQNYVYSYYIAELWSTVSMLPMLMVCIVGNYQAYRHSFGIAFHLVFSLLGLISLGSAFFHATLLYTGQVLDELPMVWGTVVGFYIIIERETQCKYRWLAPGLCAYTVAFTAAYFVLPDYFLVFLMSYICGILVTAALSYKVLQEPANYHKPHQKKSLLSCIVIMFLGAAVWFSENLFCPSLRNFHLNVFCHIFWHCSCAAGPYCWLVFAAFDRLQNSGRSPVMRWHACIPFVEDKP